MEPERTIKTEIKELYEDENNFNMEAEPSAPRDLSSDLDDDFPISEPREVKQQQQQSGISMNFRRHFIAPAKDAKNIVEIKRDHHVHLPMLLRKNWRKKRNNSSTISSNSSKKVSSSSTTKMSGRNTAVHSSSSPSGGPPPKIRRNA